MEVWELPTSIVVGGIKYDIRTDFRAILDILKTFNDPEFENDEKWIVCLTILYVDFGNMHHKTMKKLLKKPSNLLTWVSKTMGRNNLM